MPSAAATAYGKAQKSAFVPIELEDDLYDAMIKDVQDSTGKDFDTGEPFPQYSVTFELTQVVKPDGSPITLMSWIRIPPTLISDGIINENSNLYAFLKALGYEDDDMDVDPSAWQGKDLRINVENKAPKSGPNAGQARPRVTGYKPVKGKTAPKAVRKEPVAAKTAPASEDF